MTAPTVNALEHWATALGELGATRGEDAPGDDLRIDQLRRLEELKSAVCAAQARVAHAFDESQRTAQRRAGMPAARVGRGIASQVALARRISPARATHALGFARVLCTEMPHTLAALTSGRIDEWRAILLARETACLELPHRRTIDEEVAGDPSVETLSTKELVARASRLAAKLDSRGVAERQALAEGDRRVTLRPAPDTMSYLTALVPVADGVAMYAALRKAADAAREAGDSRGRGQIMADTMVALVTGRSGGTPPPVDLHLVMTDKTLLAGDDEPAQLPGYGVVPAGWARELVGRALTHAAVWVRRLYTAPTTGQLMAMDSRRRRAPASLAAFIVDRDQLCRTPWCGAPLRHVDHVVPHRQAGPTTVTNLQGLCVYCNHAKEAIGWTSLPRPGPDHVTQITTPTGHVYLAGTPMPPGGDDDQAA